MKHPGGGASGQGHTAKHTRSKKHVHGKGKHHPKHQPAGHHAHSGTKVHTVARHPHHPRGLALGDALPVCAAEALAMSLRLAGGAVSDEDVLALHCLAAGAEDAAASILSVLDAASRFGLAGVRPVITSLPPPRHGHEGGGWWNRTTWSPREGPWRHPDAPADSNGSPRTLANLPVILGVDVPGPHAVLAVPDGWWSWGSLWSPWTRAVSEAWVISWQ